MNLSQLKPFKLYSF